MLYHYYMLIGLHFTFYPRNRNSIPPLALRWSKLGCFLLTFYPLNLLPDDVNRINATALVYEKLESLPSENLEKALRYAEHLILKAYGRKILFTLSPHKDLEKYFSDQENQVAPFMVDGEDFYDIFEGGAIEEKYYNALEKQIGKYGFKEVASLFRESVGDNPGGDVHLLTNKLFDLYLSGIQSLKDFKCQNNEKLLNQNTKHYLSYYHWYYHSMYVKPMNMPLLVFVNTPIIDDDLISAPPHTLVRGGIVHGFTAFGNDTALISYWPFLSSDLSRSGRLDALIKVIGLTVAHEVGAHLIMNLDDHYSHEGCLSCPCSGSNYDRYLSGFEKISPCPLTHRTIDKIGSQIGRGLIRIRVHAAKNDHESIMQELASTIKLGSDDNLRALILSQVGYCLIKKHQDSWFSMLSWKCLYHASCLDPKLEQEYLRVLGLRSSDKLPWIKARSRGFSAEMVDEIFSLELPEDFPEKGSE